MKSNAPWSVKGIERDVRETAKEAARREGMTVGEWLSQVIYAASDPESSNGEIEGLKISDLVTAIEHLNKRVISAESKSAAALDALSRNFGGVVERVQRLERARPGEAGSGVEERLSRLEARISDRQRIETLKALEKAVSQVALQYDAAHKQTLARMDATERQLQELASRLDLAGAVPEGGEGALSAIGDLKNAVDGMAERIARAERIASEAAKLHAEAAASIDAAFVERTGARLRILGDEIKRSNDQIRALEGSIKKLSGQIDAAEKRSSEGVEKVAETIAELKSRVAQAKDAEGEFRQEIEAAVAAVTQRAEERIAELQRSFESIAAKIAAPPAAAIPIAPIERAPRPVEPAVAAEEAEEEAEEEEAGEIDTGFEAFSLDDEDESAAAMDEAEEDEDDVFAFDLDKEAEARRAREAPGDALDEIGEEGAAPLKPETVSEAPQNGLDAILAEFDQLQEPQARAETAREPQTRMISGEALPAGAEGESARPQAAAAADLLKRARLAAKEYGQASEEISDRRHLSAKQRALLAARIRRKRLAKEAPRTDLAIAPEASAEEEAPRETAGDEPRASLIATATGALSGLHARLPGAKALGTDEGSEPDLTGAAQGAFSRIRTKPVTIALGVAIVLAAAALFFLVKDLMFAGAELEPQRGGALTAGDAKPGAPKLQAPDAPAAAPAIDPRALYLASVDRLRAAKNDSEMKAAIEGVEQAAMLGHPPAQLQLGEFYKLGQGVDQDPAKARLWYERAANGGNVLAMHRIGVMEARGQGGPPDEAGAVAWFEKASKLGLVDSQYNLGALYHPGGEGAGGLARDAAKAYYWYSLAARNGDEQAGALAAALGPGLPADQRAAIDADVAAWRADEPDPEANEVAPAS